jgi:hypothetical protein
MTSQQQYQLDTEYRNRQMVNAENARLVQAAQSNQPEHNFLGAFVSKVQQFVNNQQVQSKQTQSAMTITDTQNMPAVG